MYIHLIVQPSPPVETSLPPLPCACANLRRATRAVTQVYQQEVRRAGFRGTQFSLLQVLARAGELSQGRLGALLATDSTTLTRTLAPLRRRGWIKAKAGEDRRERRWRITPAGQRQLQRGLPHWQKAQERLRQTLGGTDWNQLLPLLKRVTEAALRA